MLFVLFKMISLCFFCGRVIFFCVNFLICCFIILIFFLLEVLSLSMVFLQVFLRSWWVRYKMEVVLLMLGMLEMIMWGMLLLWVMILRCLMVLVLFIMLLRKMGWYFLILGGQYVSYLEEQRRENLEIYYGSLQVGLLLGLVVWVLQVVVEDLLLVFGFFVIVVGILVVVFLLVLICWIFGEFLSFLVVVQQVICVEKLRVVGDV